MRPHDDPNHVFTLHVRGQGNEPKIVIHAFDRTTIDRAWALEVEVRQGGKVIFPRGKLYCAGAARGWSRASQDGPEARALVLSLVAMRPGDTDAEYFDDYTLDQRDWAEANGEHVSMVRYFRYCDPETGDLRKRYQGR